MNLIYLKIEDWLTEKLSYRQLKIWFAFGRQAVISKTFEGARIDERKVFNISVEWLSRKIDWYQNHKEISMV